MNDLFRILKKFHLYGFLNTKHVFFLEYSMDIYMNDIQDAHSGLKMY